MMFSKMVALLLRDNLHAVKLRKILQFNAILSRKNLAHKNGILNCLVNTH